jgi:hypothetical protein
MDRQTYQKLFRNGAVGVHALNMKVGVPCGLADKKAHEFKLILRDDGAVNYISCTCSQDDQEIVRGAMRTGASSCMSLMDSFKKLAGDESLSEYDGLPNNIQGLLLEPMKLVKKYMAKTRQSRKHESEPPLVGLSDNPEALAGKIAAKYNGRLQDAITLAMPGVHHRFSGTVRVRRTSDAQCLAVMMDGVMIANRVGRQWMIFRSAIRNDCGSIFVIRGRGGHCFVCETSCSSPTSHVKSSRHKDRVVHLLVGAITKLRGPTDPVVILAR